jgi:hypothetical protein
MNIAVASMAGMVRIDMKSSQNQPFEEGIARRMAAGTAIAAFAFPFKI